MRNKNQSMIDGAWKALSLEHKKMVQDWVNSFIATKDRTGPGLRDGQLEAGSLQMFNLLSTEYIRFGGSGGGNGPPIVGR